jgi:hypothetical protein
MQQGWAIKRAFYTVRIRCAPFTEELAGRQGFELGAGPVSNMVMARDFWSKRLKHRQLLRSVSFTAVHPSPPVSPPVVEIFWRRVSR